MEGRGVTSYDVDNHKPSYAFSASTTEFDDELIRRGIQTFEQAMMRKGASAAEAKRLAQVKEKGQQQEEEECHVQEQDARNKDEKQQQQQQREQDGDSSGEDDDDDYDDDFLQRYRQQRLQELKQQERSRRSFGQVIFISRPEWTHHVNEDSHDTWVVVTLTSSDTERTGCTERAVQQLAVKFQYIKFVAIASTAAIANWPEEHLPTVFLYRNGTKQQQLIRLPVDLSPEGLEWILAQNGVLQTTLNEDPMSNTSSKQQRIRGYEGSSKFGGITAQLATRPHGDDEDDDSDEF